jgi:hypothetical protein
MAGTREVLPCCTWTSEQWLHEIRAGDALPLASWAMGHAGVDAIVIPSVDGLVCPAMSVVPMVIRWWRWLWPFGQ